MPLDGVGAYAPPAPEFPAVANTTILASDFNEIILDLSAALSQAIFRDGQAAFTANQSLGGFKLVNVKDGVSPQDAVTMLQAFTDPVFHGTTVTGVVVDGSAMTISVAALKVTSAVDFLAAPSVRLPSDTTGVTQALGDASTKLATDEFVQAAAFQAALPAQTAAEEGQVISSHNLAGAWTAGGTPGQFLQRAAGGVPVWATVIPPNIKRSARTANTMLVAGDNQKLIDIASGSFTQTFDAPAALGDGWFCYLKNSGDGDVIMQGEVFGPEQVANGAFEAGPDVVVNGTFATGTDWTSGGGWAISAGTASAASASTLTANVPPLMAGVLYGVTYTVLTRTAGSVTPRCGTVAGIARTAAGTYTDFIVSNGTAFAMVGAAFSGSVDNVSAVPLVGWSLNAAYCKWDLANREVDFTALDNGTVGLQQTFPALTSGALYELTYAVPNWISGAVTARLGGTQALVTRSAAGTYTQRFSATAAHTTLEFIAIGGAFTGSIDSVSLKAVTAAAGMPDADVMIQPWMMYPGELRLVQCDGATLRTSVLHPFCKTYAASGYFMKPPGYTLVEGLLWGAGAGGLATRGGGGGACLPFSKSLMALSPVVTVLIGAGGAGSVTVATPGGASYFGTLLAGGAPSAEGGSAVPPLASTDLNHTSSAFRGGIIHASSPYFPGHASYGGGAGGDMSADSYVAGIPGGASIFGGGGGGALSGSNFAFPAGVSSNAGDGGSAGYGVPAEAGKIPAGGGGGSNVTPGAGARGEMRIWGVV